MDTISERIEQIRQRMASAARRAGRSTEDIRLVAVSKLHPTEAIREAFSIGQTLFGENRVQEVEKKLPTLADLDADWHFIGHLQTNKAKKVVPLVSMIETVDSDRLIETLNKEAEKAEKCLDILLQVNVGGEDQKYGVAPDEFPSLLDAALDMDRLRVRGLMTIPPYCGNPEDVRPYFAQLRELSERHSDALKPADGRLELSMGMSHDFEIAIEEGATLIRVGTAIFGERNYG